MDVFEQLYKYINVFNDFDVNEDLNLLLEYKLMWNENQEPFVQMDPHPQSIVEV
jgi:ssDNA-specific exonuclease RecJ